MKKFGMTLLAGIVLLIALIGGQWTGDSSLASDRPQLPISALSNRPKWTGSRIAGSPEPPSPFTTEPAFPDLKLDRPVHLAVAPGSDRLFICLELAQVVSVPLGDAKATHADPFIDIRTKNPRDPKAADRRRIWSIAFHPKYRENGYVFACYIEYGEKNVNRICRLTVPATLRAPGFIPVAAPDSEKTIIEWPAGEDHFGGCLAFGTDGMLYFSAGDGHGYADGNQTGQNISDLNASIMRIDVDHVEGDRAYRIPTDNPFRHLKDARHEVWAYGLRNVWKFSFDNQTGALWAADVGQDLWEPIALVERGGNYGWSVTEGTHDFRSERPRGPTPILKPIYEHEHSEARSATGGYVYRGNAFPELTGHYVYGDFETGKVWALKYEPGNPPGVRELVDTPFKLVAFGQRPDGELLLLDYQGNVHRLIRNVKPDNAHSTQAFPRKLSQTGLFADTAKHLMAPGVVPYAVNSPLWSDGSIKHRYMAIPGDGKISYRNTDSWAFPEGSVLVKTFEMETRAGDSNSRKRLETRLLHIEQGHWRGYTYIWNDAQTDADLLELPSGTDRLLTIADPMAADGIRKLSWHFPGRAECTLCHTMPAGFVLGLSTLQMNRDFDFGSGHENQIRALEQAGLFDKPVLRAHNLEQSDGNYGRLPKMPAPADTTAPLNDRARAYLHANCSHCHRKWGGGNALFELQYDRPTEGMRIIGELPQHGSHGLKDPRLVVPGDSDRSMLLHRMRTLGPLRMPRVASVMVDVDGIRLIEQWINQMPKQ